MSRYSTPPMAPLDITERLRQHFGEPTEARVYSSPRRQAQLRLDANFAAKDCGKWADEMADKYGVPRPARVKP